LPYVDGNANMAKSGASKGAKKINAFNDGKLDGVNVAQGIVRKVEDIKNLSAKDQARAIGIIHKSSRGMERDKRMNNFLTDLYD
jgi:hypothetical protein